VTIFLLRHASAVRRVAWSGPRRLRPLTAGGHRQARRLAEGLGAEPLDRLLASPALRCRQTLEPLAARLRLPLETDGRLGEGAGVEAALQLLLSLGDQNAALCGHGGAIAGLIERLASRGPGVGRPLLCEKGSVWVLEGLPQRLETATYVPPPARRRRREPASSDDEPPGPWYDPAKQRLAVLDLGSSSFHLLVADVTPTGEIRRVLRERTMLRLGAAVGRNGEIPEKACRKAVETARALRRIADDTDAERVLPVATAALRDARNGGALAERIAEALEAPVRLLSGAEEARLMFAAFRRRLVLPPGLHLGIDLGGGSLELALGDGEAVRWEATLRLGVARLHARHVRSDPMRRREERAIRERVTRLLEPCVGEIRRWEPGLCIAAGGTVSALARRLVTRRTCWPAGPVGQLFVPRAELQELRRELVASSHSERLSTPGLAKTRADLLPAGAVILDAAVAALGVDGLTVSDWGLREGVLLEALGLADAASARWGA
jgi:exopolyphosphatase/guanosine-5'-triphosphate,3'-diphosphate pyrophosphatase